MRPAGALILAAGMSTRMKGFKPLLDFHGRTMIGQVIHNFQKAGAAPIILVLGYRGDDIKDSLAGEPVIFVRNENYASSQMFDSVKIGLRKAAGVCGRVLIAPCDAPLIRPEVIRHVMESEYLMARPSFQGRPGHPVLLSCSLTEQICGYRGEWGLRGAMESLGIPMETIQADGPGIYLDADTPEEYLALKNMENQFTNRRKRDIIDSERY